MSNRLTPTNTLLTTSTNSEIHENKHLIAIEIREMHHTIKIAISQPNIYLKHLKRQESYNQLSTVTNSYASFLGSSL
jgi:hypothetical protein